MIHTNWYQRYKDQNAADLCLPATAFSSRAEACSAARSLAALTSAIFARTTASHRAASDGRLLALPLPLPSATAEAEPTPPETMGLVIAAGLVSVPSDAQVVIPLGGDVMLFGGNEEVPFGVGDVPFGDKGVPFGIGVAASSEAGAGPLATSPPPPRL